MLMPIKSIVVEGTITYSQFERRWKKPEVGRPKSEEGKPRTEDRRPKQTVIKLTSDFRPEYI